MSKKEPVIIYNLFPRLLGHVGNWKKHISRIARMKFNWIYINPFHYPGFSGSLYAPKDYYAFNPVFIPEGQDGFQLLGSFIEECKKKGIRVMMDLVINHSASDSILAEKHPEWYRREPDGSLMHPYCVDPADTRKKTIWGDLAEIDNDPGASHKDALWRYWKDLMLKYMDVGFDGFRADAAYKVPVELWEFLIGAARKKDPGVLFFAETLGAEEEDLKEVVGAGFDCVTNSSKWWDFREDWCPHQYYAFRKYAPSVSFPESHDTPRLFADLKGNINGQKMWYAFSAFFSQGILMPLGFEWGFLKRMDVVRTTPDDWEEKTIDISDFIKKANSLKYLYAAFHEESDMHIRTSPDDVFLAMVKTPLSKKSQKAFVIINKDIHHEQHMSFEWFLHISGDASVKKIIFPGKKKISDYDPKFAPGEVRVLV